MNFLNFLGDNLVIFKIENLINFLLNFWIIIHLNIPLMKSSLQVTTFIINEFLFDENVLVCHVFNISILDSIVQFANFWI